MAWYSRCAGEGGRSPPRLYSIFRMRGVAHGCLNTRLKKPRSCRFPRCLSTLRSRAIDFVGARRPTLQSEICVPRLAKQSTEINNSAELCRSCPNPFVHMALFWRKCSDTHARTYKTPVFTNKQWRTFCFFLAKSGFIDALTIFDGTYSASLETLKKTFCVYSIFKTNTSFFIRVTNFENVMIISTCVVDTPGGYRHMWCRSRCRWSGKNLSKYCYNMYNKTVLGVQHWLCHFSLWMFISIILCSRVLLPGAFFFSVCAGVGGWGGLR